MKSNKLISISRTIVVFLPLIATSLIFCCRESSQNTLIQYGHQQEVRQRSDPASTRGTAKRVIIPYELNLLRMTDTAITYARRIEAAATSGNLSEELQKASDAIKASPDKEAADKLLQDVTRELYSRGALPKLARSWAQANFNELDLNGNGSISASELDRMLQADLLKAATNPFEKQLLRYMSTNREKIAAAANDEWGRETNITKKDLTEFEKQSEAADRRSVMAQRLVERFGNRENFRRLDANNDGFVADAELKAALDGKRAMSLQ